MILQDAIRQRLQELMSSNNLNGNKLSLNSGISRSCINKFLRKSTKSIKIESIELICEALNITLADFFNAPIFRDIEVKD